MFESNARETGKDHTVEDAWDELKHALAVAREPSSPFPRPHFTGACVSRKIQSCFAKVYTCTHVQVTDTITPFTVCKAG